MPDKDGADDKKKMKNEEVVDYLKDTGRYKRSPDTKDATSYPPSEEVKKTQKINTGPSAFELIKKKYKGQIMNVGKKGKKKVQDEFDLTQVAEAFGGYIVEAPVEDGKIVAGKDEAKKQKKIIKKIETGRERGERALAKAITGVNVKTQGPQQAAATQALKDMRMSGDKKFSDITPDVKSGMRATAAGKGRNEPVDYGKINQQNLKKVQSSTPKNQQSEIGKSLEKISPDRYKFVDTDDRPTGETTPKKSTATRANYPKTRAELEAKRKEYEIDRQGKATDAGIEKFARRRKQSNLPLSQDELDSAKKAMVGTGEKGTDVGKYGGRLGRRRGKNQPTFAQLKAKIDDVNPVRTSPVSGGKIPDNEDRRLERVKYRSAEEIIKDFLEKERRKGKSVEDIKGDPRFLDIEKEAETTAQGIRAKSAVERETGTRTRPFTRVGTTSGDLIQDRPVMKQGMPVIDPKTKQPKTRPTEVTPTGRVKPIGTLGRRAEKAQQRSAVGALGGFLAKSAVPATAGLEAAERLRKGEKGVALSAIQAMDIPYLSKAAGVLNALQTYRRGQQAAADRQSMVDVATGGGGGGRKGPRITSSGGEFDREGPKPTKGGDGLAAVGGDAPETDTVTSRILATQLPNIGKRLRRGAGSVPRGLRGGTVGRRSAGGFTAT